MIRPSTFYDLVSGRSSGPRATLLRGALRVAELPYRTAVAWRNRRFERGSDHIHRAAVPVISVGNLTVGGTGKTPLVKWIARYLLGQGLRVAILSRGYGASGGALNDEAMELERDLPDVPHLQNPDRISSAEEAITEYGAEVLLMDDGFQHRRLHRDVDIVLLDALEPFGYGHLLPRGTLREPCTALARANVVVLSRADLIDATARRHIQARVRRFASSAAWCEVQHAPLALVNAAGEQRSLQEMAAEPVAAFCGIGNPAAFRATLSVSGFRIASWREFPDHHPYSPHDVADLDSWRVASGAAAAICTLKDLVKLQRMDLGKMPYWALAIEMEFNSGRDAVTQALDDVCGQGSLQRTAIAAE